MDIKFFKKEIKEKDEIVIEREICDKVYDFFVEYMKELGYEDRLGQQDMALDIAESIRDNQHIIVEAGVGIGKSYAYLVPLLLYNRIFEEPIAISTSTISLQEQLMGDIKAVSNMMGYEPEVVLAKGMTHYICRKRAQQHINSLYLDDNEQWKKYSYIKKWMINKGDRSELSDEVSEEFWNKINVNECLYGKCNESNKCYFMNKRSSMANTNGIILCNHDLLVVDAQKKLKRERELLSSRIKFIVIDEAHNLEEKVRTALKSSWDYNRTVGTIKDSIYFLKKSYKEVENEYLENIENLVREVFINVSKQANRYIEEHEVNDVCRIEINIDYLKEKILHLSKYFKELNVKVSLVDNNLLINNATLEEEQMDIIEELKKGEEFFGKLAYKDIESLNWIEPRKMKCTYSNINICGCPKHMNKIIREMFFYNENESKDSMRKLPKVIMTSATLANNFQGDNEQRYEYIINNVGLPVDESTFLSDPKESPFDYDKNAIIYYKNDMPHPMDERRKFLDKAIEEIKDLVTITEGKSLILFTAKEDMKYVYDKLNQLKLPYNVYKQSEESSQEHVIEKFKSEVNSILLGTGSYWEGINVPGKALSNLIIVRLPFPVPDPIIEYKRKIAKNPLMEVNVPEMIIKLRQGIGRLIRNQKDTGIVSILDPRVGEEYKNEYKELVWNTLPIKTKTTSLLEIEKFSKEKILSSNNEVREKEIKIKTFREYASEKSYGKDFNNKFVILDTTLDENFYKIHKTINDICSRNDNKTSRNVLESKLIEILDTLRAPATIREIDIEISKIDTNLNFKGRMDGILRRLKVWKTKGIILKDEGEIINLLGFIKKTKERVESDSPKYNSLIKILNKNNDVQIVVKDEVVLNVIKRLSGNMDINISLYDNKDKNQKKLYTFMPKIEGLKEGDKILIYEHERETYN